MLLSRDIDGFDTLVELAMDLVWTWDHRADRIWSELDLDLWLLTRDPLIVLQSVTNDKLKAVLSNPDYRKLIESLRREDEILHRGKTGWFQKKFPNSKLKTVAYFSMEFMLSENLPIYSGGLGNVAGDQLKTMNDLSIPVVGMGLLYGRGYFRQIIGKDGIQQVFYPNNSPYQMPVKPVHLPSGEWLRVEVVMPGWKVGLRVWEAKIGRVQLYLLDSNDVTNSPTYRAITSELYGGNAEMRLQQEIVLGIGGWRALKALKIEPDVCHLNEGHAAFAILERAHDFQKENNVSFEEALAATRAGNVFTTHTAVGAGFDRFAPSLIQHYLEPYAKDSLGISLECLLALGRVDKAKLSEPFSPAYLAIRGSGSVNGVSQLHETVSQSLFSPLFPRFPIDEVPIGHVTNGVHMKSWHSAQAEKLWMKTCEKDCWLGSEIESMGRKIKDLPDEVIWGMRNEARTAMIQSGRVKATKIWETRGYPPEEIARAKALFDVNVLTLGFARRFATYKRPNMLLQNPQRLVKILTNKERPVQLVLAGKAHPADIGGQELIRQWFHFISSMNMRQSVFFVPDYDVQVTARLVGGVDLWINTPRRPWEACGTSGMKVLVNGGLNLSELDGWWVEGYSPEVGWAIGDGQEHDNDPTWDIQEANQLYDLLESEIIPMFYDRDEKNIPRAWVTKVRASMSELTPKYSSNRAVFEYLEKYYLPSAEKFQKRSENKGLWAKEYVAKKQRLESAWPTVGILSTKKETQGKEHLVEAVLDLKNISADLIQVECYANGPEKFAMTLVQKLTDQNYLFRVKIPAKRPVKDYTVRFFPHIEGVNVALELPLIHWER